MNSTNMKTTLLCLLIFLSSYASANQWTQKANVGGAGRADAAGCAIGDKGYIGTGYVSGYTKDWWEYDTLANTWTQKADFAGNSTVESTCIAIDGKAYLLPFATNDFYAYNPVTNTWAMKASFPGQSRQGAIGFAIDGKGYFGLGATPSMNPQLDDLWEYDVALDMWTQKASLPALPRMHSAAFAIGSKGYVGMGNNSGSSLMDFWMYDPVFNNWTQKTNFPGGARYEGTAFAIGGFGYMGGGYGTSPQSTFWRYNPITDTWAPIASLPPGGRVETVCFSIGNSGYLGTGWDGTNFINDFWKYSPDSIMSGVETMVFNESETVHVYPNPVSDAFIVEHTFNHAIIEVFDATGKLVFRQSTSAGHSIHVESLPAGHYNFQLLHEKGRATGRFLKVN